MVSLVGCPMPIFNAENMLATIGVQSAEAQTVLNLTKLIIPQNEISVNTQNDKNIEQEQLRTKPLTDIEVLRRAMDKQKHTFVGRQKCVFLLSMGYEKDIFAVFAYEFELLHNRSFLVKSFAYAHGEIIYSVNCEI